MLRCITSLYHKFQKNSTLLKSNYSVIMIFVVLYKNREGVSGTESPRSGAPPRNPVFSVLIAADKKYFLCIMQYTE